MCVLHAHPSSPRFFVRAQSLGLCESTQCGLEELSCDAASAQACAGEEGQWQCDCAETHSRLSSELEKRWIRGRSCHEKSLLHMAERISEGTKRGHRTIALENANSDCGVGTRANADSRGSDRVMASSDDRGMRLDND